MSLKDRLIQQIRMDGPIPVSAFMQTCLHDPKDGYYANGAGLGKDFITAPETSQMFGELLGLWIVNEWKALGAHSTFNVVEMGPGRGTLMADAMRAAHAATDSNFANGLFLHLIEASPALRDIQAQKLEPHNPKFKKTLDDDIMTGTTLIISNEFLDCLPARQFVREGETWRERILGLDETGALAFGVDRSDLKAEAAAALPAPGLSAEAELQPGLDGLVETLLARHKTGDRFHALFIDYGPDKGPPTDTLRAYKNGKQVHPLSCPGEADLTVDVDFARLAKLATRAGLSVSGPVTQGAFLGALGLQARLNALIKAHPEEAEALFEGAQKLVGPDQMGARFKAICISSPGLPKPAGFKLARAQAGHKLDKPPLSYEAIRMTDSNSLAVQTPPSTQTPSLAHMGRIAHGFFGSRGGVSTGLYASLNAGMGSDDDPACVAQNRARIASAIGAPAPGHLLSCYQHHSADALSLDAPFEGRPKGDAMVTRTPGLALAIMTADCVPILFADEAAGVIGAAHSGWKGALGGISEATLNAMEALGANVANITAAIGPCIGQASYEVGPDLQETFVNAAPNSARFFSPGAGDRLQFDLQGFVNARLVRAGVKRVDVVAHDTCALKDMYFSNRRRNHDGLPDYGRNASVIMLKP